jgi:hypothetical protein
MEITALEESYNAYSSFIFPCKEGDRDCTYPIEALEQEIHSLEDSGWEIGLHGGCEA